MTKNIIKIITVFLLISLLLSGCSNNLKQTTNQSKDELNGLSVYKDTKNKSFVKYNGEMDIKLSYPSTWQNLPTEDENHKSIYVSTDATRSMFNLASYETDFTIEELSEEFKKEIQENMNVIGQVNVEMINLNGRKAYRVDYILEVNEATVAGIQTGSDETKLANYHFIQVAFIDSGKAYTLTIATPERNYDKMRNILEEIIKSFDK